MKETEYMYGTARIRALENRIVGRERLNTLLDTKDVGEVMARLGEYGITPGRAGERTDAAISSEEREEMLLRLLRDAYRDVEEAAPRVDTFVWFRYPYDCHNLKLAIKCRLRSIPAEETRCMMFDFGTVRVDGVLSAVSTRDYRVFPPAMAVAAIDAEEAYAKSGDPQQISARLDKACYADMLSAAEHSGEGTLVAWIKAKIDLLNAVICLRILRMDRGDTGRMFLSETLLPGGHLEASFFTDIYDRATASDIEVFWSAMASSRYAGFAKAAEKTGKTPADVEKCADDAFMALVREDARVAFGAPVMAGYLVGWETAVRNLRILLAAKEAGLAPERIRERVRESYV